jgi:hypothetical protein
MIKEHLFVNIIIFLQLGAVVNYAFNRKWFLMTYWLVGVLTNLVITYGIKK